MKLSNKMTLKQIMALEDIKKERKKQRAAQRFADLTHKALTGQSIKKHSESLELLALSTGEHRFGLYMPQLIRDELELLAKVRRCSMSTIAVRAIIQELAIAKANGEIK